MNTTYKIIISSVPRKLHLTMCFRAAAGALVSQGACFRRSRATASKRAMIRVTRKPYWLRSNSESKRWQLRLDLLVDIYIADFDINGNYLKLWCANLYFKSLFYLHDYFKTTTNSNPKA